MKKWFGGNEDESKGASKASDAESSVSDLARMQRARHYAPLSQIEAYWTALRGTRLMPLRSEIDPRGLTGALENCFVLERIAPGLARLRVAGSHLTDMMGMEVRGMPISAFLSAESRQDFGMALEEIFETPAIGTFDLSSPSSLGRPAMVGRIMLLPVRSDLGDASRLLGGIVTEGEAGRVPRRFDITRTKLTQVYGRDVKTYQPTEMPQSRADQAAAQPVPAPASPEQFRQVLADVPYLKIVD